MISRFFARDPTPVSAVIACRDSDRPCRRHRLPKRLPLDGWRVASSTDSAGYPYPMHDALFIGCIGELWWRLLSCLAAHIPPQWGCGTAGARSFLHLSRVAAALCLCGGCYSRGLSWVGATQYLLHMPTAGVSVMVSLAPWHVILPSAEHLL